MQPGKNLLLANVREWLVPGFSKTDDDSASEKTAEILSQTLANRGNSPDEHNQGKPVRRFKLLDEDIRRDLEEDVRDKEDQESDVILISYQPQILCQALNLCVTDWTLLVYLLPGGGATVYTVQKCQQEEQE